MTLGEKIKELRIKKGMTQDDLAVATGTTKASISNYERNRRMPKYAVMDAIANALDVPFPELFTYFIITERNDTNNTVTSDCGKRAVRKKRLLATFDQLSDSAQKKAIERIEELTLIPSYRR